MIQTIGGLPAASARGHGPDIPGIRVHNSASDEPKVNQALYISL